MGTDKITIKNLPNTFQSLISNGVQAVIGDEPVKEKIGMTPPQLVLGGLALCKVASIRYYAMSKGIANVGNIEAELVMEPGAKDKSLHTDVKIKIKIEGDVSDETKQELMKQADMCYIHRLLQGNWTITQELAQ